MDGRAVRKGANENWFREVNERLEARTLERDGAGRQASFRIVCECVDEECSQRIAISLVDYEQVRANARRFVVRPGHGDASIERVVAVAEGFDIVEKFGDAGRAVAVEGSRTGS